MLTVSAPPDPVTRTGTEAETPADTCPRHEGPRSFCGCGIPLTGEAAGLEQESASEHLRNVLQVLALTNDLKPAYAWQATRRRIVQRLEIALRQIEGRAS